MFNAVEMTSTLENPLKPVIMELISEPDSQKVTRSMKPYKVAQNSYFLNQSTYLSFLISYSETWSRARRDFYKIWIIHYFRDDTVSRSTDASAFDPFL